ncbi:cyclin-B1-2-like [Spinacia oleracea]|uniref:Cyclin-B1-2-like n=1 Tax=Spinacia oleracea TaxID=3562 RepID=A0ABM3RS10_SPIOL|nr:cyclin-B1-2-like [Spinacia oleracea]
MVASSAVYVARHTLFKEPVWTETLRTYSGFSESQLMECAKMLANLHSVATGHRLQTVDKKYSKSEKCVVAFCSPPKSLLGFEFVVSLMILLVMIL